MLLALAAAVALTPAEAQTLPVAELARRVLGAAGTLVVDVARPSWPQCVGLCAPQPPHVQGEPPPLRTLTFYTGAVATGDANWLGLCRATAIDVTFDATGAVTGLDQRATVGWLGALTRQAQGSGPAAITTISAQYAQVDARCRALPTTGNFISTNWPLDGVRALIAVSLIHDSMASPGVIRVTCSIDLGHPEPCGTPADLAALAGDVAVDRITGIERVDANTGYFVTGGPADSGCYRVSLAQPFGQSDQIALCVRVGETLTVTKAAFSRGRVVY